MIGFSIKGAPIGSPLKGMSLVNFIFDQYSWLLFVQKAHGSFCVKPRPDRSSKITRDDCGKLQVPPDELAS